MVAITLEHIGGSRSSWVAEIKGSDPRYGLAREFLRGIRDYSRANSVRTRGVFETYELLEGRVYEINDRHSWKGIDRYFAVVKEGKIERVEQKEVMEHIQAIALRAAGDLGPAAESGELVVSAEMLRA